MGVWGNMRAGFALTAAAAAISFSSVAFSADGQKKVDDVAIGAAFISTCVKLAPDDGAIRSAIQADPNWKAVPVPAGFGLQPGSSQALVDTWSQTIDGHDVLLALITDPSGKGLQHNCAFVVRDDRQAMWYFRSVSDNLKQYGMKLRQQNIPHWRFHQGKFGNGQRGEVELRSRSAALPGKDVLHLVIAY